MAVGYQPNMDANATRSPTKLDSMHPLCKTLLKNLKVRGKYVCIEERWIGFT